MKERYIDIIERVVGAYTDEHIDAYIDRVKKEGISEHGFARLTADIGILLSHGRRQDLRDRFSEMMELCLDLLPTAKAKYPKVGNDFAVKELVLALLALEGANVYEPEKLSSWRERMKSFSVFDTYSVIASTPPVRIGNWAAYGAASEQLRKYAGIADESDFIDNQIASQLLSFDELGMYRDPHEPMLYDIVTRMQCAIILFFDYNGKYRRELEDALGRSAEITLKMQSVTGEIPYGGRSAQFVYNEAAFAALCEFYAAMMKKEGRSEDARAFRRAATLAFNVVDEWTRKSPMRHTKNYYPQDSMYGCEGYGYFDKYMTTVASFIYVAYLFADDSISEADSAPCENGGFVAQTSEHFHKTFLNAYGYFVELDANADPHYDATGIGRIHRAGVPSALCLSVPFAAKPKYNIDITNPSPLAIGCGIMAKDSCMLATEYELGDVSTDADETSLKTSWLCRLADGTELYENISLSSSGVDICVMGEGDIVLTLPALDYDGFTSTETTLEDKAACVKYLGHTCRMTSSGRLIDTGAVYANRNGHYRLLLTGQKERLNVHIELSPYCSPKG